jgi:hypothetical protein
MPLVVGRRIAGVLAAWAVLGTAPARASEPAVDVSIVTAIDISDSVPVAEVRAGLAALAAAIRAPEFLGAVGRGRQGRVRLAVFAWHHQRYEILPWTEVGSPAEAEAAARGVERRIEVNVDVEARRADGSFIGRLTDLSRALDHAGALSEGSGAGRVVVNVVGNGADNMGEPAAPARDRLLAAGATVNGLVFGGDAGVAGYFRSEVAGGAGSFVIAAGGPEGLAEAMRRKLILDLVAALGGGVERVKGIEPSSLAWEAKALPLSYTRTP